MKPLEGSYAVKLEFDDDSFELTSAIFLADGTVRCISRKAPEAGKFKMVTLDGGGDLRELECTVSEAISEEVVASWKECAP